MNQLILSDNAYRELVRSVTANFGKYCSGKRLLSQKQGASTQWVQSTISMDRELVLTFPEKGDKHDYENAVAVHDSLRLTPLQASDPRLWARLTHVECWDYMRERWPVTDSKSTQFVRARYFVGGTDTRALLRNGIARLWWSAEISKLPRGKDPYRLTKVLLSKLDIAQQLLEHSFGKSRQLIQATLRFIEANADQCVDDGNLSRLRVRHLAMRLFHRSGISILDSIPEVALHAFLNEELKRFNSQPSQS